MAVIAVSGRNARALEILEQIALRRPAAEPDGFRTNIEVHSDRLSIPPFCSGALCADRSARWPWDGHFIWLRGLRADGTRQGR